jgi:hypothetical protein
MAKPPDRLYVRRDHPLEPAMPRDMPLDEKTRTELEAAVYRRLVAHLRDRTDLQNIELMNSAGFCRNCLANWLKEAADSRDLPMTKEESREIVYGMPYDEWQAKHQKEATPEQKAAFEKNRPH